MIQNHDSPLKNLLLQIVKHEILSDLSIFSYLGIFEPHDFCVDAGLVTLFCKKESSILNSIAFQLISFDDTSQV